MDYDFSQMNDKELEVLSADLLSAHLGNRFERFKEGKDKGVDGRFFSSPGKEVIFQCKHYLKSGVTQLLRSLKNVELPKIRKLAPDRYILVTSCRLSRFNKESIALTLSPYVDESDIFGAEDLNDLLRENPKIERAHTKLWMSSTALLKQFINNAVLGRAEDLLTQAAAKRKFYVETKNFNEAKKRLEISHIIILSGEPGIGKTTLAENLCLLYSTHGFETIDIINISDAEQVFEEGAKQLFLFDDFLGGNYLDAISGREDAHIVKFMRRIISDDSKRFILTTRTNILNLGIAISDHLHNSNLRRDEYLLKIDDLSRFEKAKIFYNHLWHSDLEEDFIDQIYEENNYIQIIDHQNYSPRLIEFITDSSRLGFPAEASEYVDYIKRNFDHPALIWRNSLMVQSNEYVRTIVKLVVFNGGRIRESDLEKAYATYCSKFISKYVNHGDIEFESITKKASESFIIRSIDRGRNAGYTLFNPSIADFILSEYRRNLEETSRSFDCLETTTSLQNLVALRSPDLLGNVGFNAVIKCLDNSEYTSEKSANYKIILADIHPNPTIQERRKIDILAEIKSSQERIQQRQQIIQWLLDDPELLGGSDLEFLVTAFGGDSLDYDETLLLARLIEDRAEEEIDDGLREVMEISMIDLIEDAANNWARDTHLDEYIDYYQYGDGDVDAQIDESKFRFSMKEFGDNFFADFPDYSTEVPLDHFESFVSEFELDGLLTRWFESHSSHREYDGDGKSYPTSTGGDTQIHDLFSRD